MKEKAAFIDIKIHIVASIYVLGIISLKRFPNWQHCLQIRLVHTTFTIKINHVAR